MHVERFAATTAPADELWSLVGDPARLPEWTDADAVEVPDELSEGDEFTVVIGAQRTVWRVITADRRLWEVRRDGPRGTLAVGVRVVDEAVRARLVLVGHLETAGPRWRARAVELPRLGARLDRWATTAIAVVEGEDATHP